MAGTDPQASGRKLGRGAERRLAAVVDRFGLPASAEARLRLLVEQLSSDPLAPTSVREPRDVVDRHLADSLVALEVDAVRQAHLAADLGSGAGVPGLPLAIARPDAEFVLLESSSRKCGFLRRAADACRLDNVRIVHDRAESFAAAERERFDLVTARAVASLEVTAEYAAPLIRVGGILVIWSGKRSDEREAAARRAARQLGLGGVEVRGVEPFPEAQHHHLYLMSKVEETPSRFPRRPGMALKRPLGSRADAAGVPDRAAPSDRARSDGPHSSDRLRR